MLKKFIRRILEYIKSHFAKENTGQGDELSQIIDAIDSLENELNISGSAEQIMETTIAKRHIKVIRQSINIMKLITEPKIFCDKYFDVLSIAQKISEFSCIYKKVQAIAVEITEKLNSMRTPAQEIAENGLVYYSVTFGSKRKEYYYLSGGKNYVEGQYVLVPVNDDMERKVAKIVSVDHFTSTNAPMPPDKLKVIISRAVCN